MRRQTDIMANGPEPHAQGNEWLNIAAGTGDRNDNSQATFSSRIASEQMMHVCA